MADRVPLRGLVVTFSFRMNERFQFGDPGLDLLLRPPGTREAGIVGERGIRSTPVARPAPVFHIGRLELEKVMIGNASNGRETMGMTVVLSEMHLSDVEIHELAFLRD
jgi:hypothetical protein